METIMGRNQLGIAAILAILLGSAAAVAQDKSVPGPTVPTPPASKRGEMSTMVINPTVEECKAGWNASMRWTQYEFKEMCARLEMSR